MRHIAYIFAIIAAALMGCERFDEGAIEESGASNVEVLEDGRLRVELDLSVLGMDGVSVSSRAADNSSTENYIETVWCLVFGEDDACAGKEEYSTSSPLIQKIKVSVNENSKIFIELEKYEGTAFVRFVANLTPREQNYLDAAKAWYDIEDHSYVRPGDEDAGANGLGTFGDYIYQSVGLDGIYEFGTYTGEDGNEHSNYTTVLAEDGEGNFVTEDDEKTGISSYKYESINTISPDPSSLSTAFPMASVGFVMSKIDEDTVAEKFGTVVDMIRVCSKVDVSIQDSAFAISEVYMIECAQESRVRSTVLDVSGTTGEETTESFNLPRNLGDSIDYLPLVESVSYPSTTSAIYFYPNSGGDYDSNSGAVNQSINPQYVIIKGKSVNYDTAGYYKIALKAQYPLQADSDDSNKDNREYWSELTYDILRNTHFTINITLVDKPGYKTLADAKDPNNPASNISYNITVSGSDGRNETLLSNGTYYVELGTTRVYMAGYGLSGTGCSINFTMHPNSADDNYYHPAVYVQADNGVTITSCFVNEKTSSLPEIDLSDVLSDLGDDPTDDEINEKIEEHEILSGMFDPGSEYYDKDIAGAYSSAKEFYYDIYDGSDDVHDVWFKVPSSCDNTAVNVNYFADSDGRVRLRIGDMLKFIPVNYSSTMISGTGGDLEIGDETSFAYDDITYLEYDPESGLESVSTDQSGDDYTWFTEDGKIYDNEDSTRELRAMIYPKSADGVTKLYVLQEVKDMDSRDENNANVIDLSNADYKENATGGTTVAELAGTEIIDMLEEGYTTIYFEGVDKTTLNLQVTLDYVEANYDGYYSVDISGVELDIANGIFLGKNYPIFRDNEQLISVVMPSSIIDIKQETFLNCTNLQFVTFGAVDDPSTSFTTTATLFNGCSSIIALTIYTKATSVKQEAMNNCGVTYFKTAHTLDVSANSSYADGTSTVNNTEEIVYEDGTSAGSYVYVFCDQDNLNTYFKTADEDGNYQFNADVYTRYE
ncbi:MAG: leucine-rich repeat protein [Rikenellaceae bacterium]